MWYYFIRSLRTTYGGIAQLARACGSYPQCHRFESCYRYHALVAKVQQEHRKYGLLVKWLRLRPLTAATGVRIPQRSPRRNGLCSIPIFLLHKKISHTRRHSSSFAKRHAQLICSLVNAFATLRCRYHLFASCACGANIPIIRIFKKN